MLGKLLKYEFKSTIRTFLGLYISMMITGLLIGIFNIANIEQGTILGIFVFFGLLVALFVLTITIMIKRFNKNLFGDEGYLMLTLPVDTKKIILSKLIASVVYIILSNLIIFVTFIMIILPQMNMIHLIHGLGDFMKYMSTHLISTHNDILNMIYIFVAFIEAFIEFVLTVYLSLAIGQLKPFQNHRNVFAIITFFVINAITTWLSNLPDKLPGTTIENAINLWSNPAALAILAASIVLCVILFMLTSYILEKKLNLE